MSNLGKRVERKFKRILCVVFQENQFIDFCRVFFSIKGTISKLLAKDLGDYSMGLWTLTDQCTCKLVNFLSMWTLDCPRKFPQKLQPKQRYNEKVR